MLARAVVGRREMGIHNDGLTGCAAIHTAAAMCRAVVWVLLGLLIASCGMKGGVGKPCVEDEHCDDRLVCFRTQHARDRDDPTTCTPEEWAKDKCKEEGHCERAGRCTPKDGDCKATRTSDCENSQRCKEAGESARRSTALVW